MELPIPKHLNGILIATGDENSEFSVEGAIQCKCLSHDFKIKIVGDDSNYEKFQVIQVTEIDENFYLIVKVECSQCSSEHLIFDNDYHGWNGYVCGGDSRGTERPQTKQWHCDECENPIHAMNVRINSQGKDDFMEEGGEELGIENWVEGFSWITIETECTKCKKK